MRVSIIGMGYVGLTTAVALAYLGHEVKGIEKDEAKLRLLCKGESPIHEPAIEELMELAGENLRFSRHATECVPGSDVVMIATGTPPQSNGQADLSQVLGAAEEVARAAEPGHTFALVVKSTVPVGTSRQVARVVHRAIGEQRWEGVPPRIGVVSNPEFLREGSALHDTLYPDRIVVGAEGEEAVDTVRRLYRPILKQSFEPPPSLPRPQGYPLPPLLTTSPESSELIKYAANAYLAIKVSFINEVAGLCEKVGADVGEVARGMGLDARIGLRYLEAGLGWGGSCLPKDTRALLAMGQEVSYPLRLVAAAIEVNHGQRVRAVEKVQDALKGLRGRLVGVLGLSFKPGTDDTRFSPSFDLIRLLLERGAHVRAHDPTAGARAACAKEFAGQDVEVVEDPYRVAEGADAIVLATAWPHYLTLDLSRLACAMRAPLLLDGRNVLDVADARRAGFVYMGMGRHVA